MMRHRCCLRKLSGPVARFTTALAAVLLSGWGTGSWAQDSAALTTALALEQAVVEAIAGAERSVTAVARFRTDGPLADGGPLERRLLDNGLPGPGLPAFGERALVPDEFAAGVVIDPAGYILTNYHVLGDPRRNRYVVMIGRRPFDVVRVLAVDEVKAGDPWTDLAVLKVEANDLEPIEFGDTRQLRKGQFVVSLGNPYHIARNGQASAGFGIISDLGRRIPEDGSAPGQPAPKEMLYHYGGLIQTDARLNMGTSGGALINLRGEMIGLTTAMASLEGFEKSIGFAIPTDESFRNTVERLKSGRRAEFGFLGVGPRDLNDAMLRQGQHGVEVAQVVPATPAAEAGIREGDIVTRLNDEPMYDSQMLMCELGKLPAGATVRLALERGAQLGRRGEVVLTTATLTKKYMPLADRGYAQIPDPTWRGMAIDYATAALSPAQLQQTLSAGIPSGTLGVLDVQRDSAAWKAGLRPGMLITHIQSQRVTKPEDFHAVADSLAGPVQIRLAAGETRELTVAE